MAIPFASAGMFMSQPQLVYNVNDVLDIDVTINSGVPVNNLLSVNLNCGSNNSLTIYGNYVNLNPGDEQTFNVQTLLSKSILGNNSESCYLTADYGEININSQEFSVDNKIDIELFLEKAIFNPSESANINGLASKANNLEVEGIVELTVGSLGIQLSKSLDEGSFSLNFTIPEDSKSGEHNLSLRIYEMDSFGEISNEGFSFELIEVNSILKKIEIVSEKNGYHPGENFAFKVSAYDQAEDIIEREVGIIIYLPSEGEEVTEFYKKLVKSGEDISVPLLLDTAPGYYKILANSGELGEQKLLYVEEHEEAEFELANNTLIAKNIGNVPYVKSIEVLIDGEIEIKNVKLEVGETKKFRILAPDGTYEVGVNDGSKDVNLGKTILTGRAIGLKEIKSGSFANFSKSSIYLLALFLFVIGVLFISIKRIRSNFKLKGEPMKKIENVSEIVVSGKKEEASVIALRLSKKSAKSYYSSSTIDDALSEAKETGAKIYEDGAYRIFLFSPALTKKNNNDLLAVKVAKKIKEVFRAHNKKFKDKIDFGIGLNNGFIISEAADSDFKFTSVGNIISSAKQISGYLDESVLLSDSIRKRVINSVKTEKVGDKEGWELKKIADRTKHEEFIKDFTKKTK
jgi:hypothetical protein